MTLDHAMVMAAGLGTRMRPLTEHTPKPLIPVAGRPLMAYALENLRAAGIAHIVVNTHYLAEQLADYLAGQADITLSHEPDLLETGGGVCNALEHLGTRPFAVTNSDTILLKGAEALERLAAAWDDARMDGLLLLHPTDRAVGYNGAGDFFLRGDHLERRGNHATAPYVFTGTQLLHPRLFTHAPDGAFSLNRLYDRALSEGRLCGVVHTGDWLHVGDPEGLRLAEQFLC